MMILLITLLMSPMKNGPIKNYMIHWGANIFLECRTVSPSEILSICLSIHPSVHQYMFRNGQILEKMSEKYGEHNYLSKSRKVESAITDLRIVANLTIRHKDSQKSVTGANLFSSIFTSSVVQIYQHQRMKYSLASPSTSQGAWMRSKRRMSMYSLMKRQESE